MSLRSWGNIPEASQEKSTLDWRHEPLPAASGSLLPYGMGRSYGDSCLNDGGTLLQTRQLNHFIEFDQAAGLLRCEAGASLDEILEAIVPAGWFLPVSPGTRFVTVGGAIANDIHGKNHHQAGTFGRHLTAFELKRSDGSTRICSPTENADWFAATIGGLGLTGLITWAEFSLSPIPSPFLEVEQIKFRNLDEFFELAEESDEDWGFTVSWIDCLAKGNNLGRGLFMRGNWASEEATRARPRPKAKAKTFPFFAPNWLLNPLSVRAFNFAYYHRQLRKRVESQEFYEPFFYPLDAIHHWNRLYGKRGFYQHQSVVPMEENHSTIRTMLETIADSGQASFLVVLKVFGEQASPGMLSFPRPGITLALDFANRGAKTLALMDELDVLVGNAGGSVYPAKDARMSADDFKKFYPNWKAFEAFIDPGFSSSFQRRVFS